MRTLACVLLSLLSAACTANEPRDERKPLPFHIAIAPLTENDVQTTDSKPGSEYDPTDMRLDASLTAALTGELQQVLAKKAFVRVTSLELQAPGGTRPQDAIQRDTQLIHAAQEQGADLLLCLKLSIQTVIREDKPGAYYVNFGLFALGGPFCWFLPDHTYIVDAEVSGWFYDPRTLARTPLALPLSETRAELASGLGHTEPINLNFTQRAPSIGDYLLSLICPCGFLPFGNEKLKQELVDRIVGQLSRGLASSVLDEEARLERGDAPFFLELGQSKFNHDASGGLILSGSARLRPTREIESLGSWKVEVNGVLAQPPTIDESEPDKDGYLHYRLEARLGQVREGAFVRLVIEAGERTPRVRSYTFRAPR